jgi:putative peptidoglycan lipid II flippase
LKISQAKNAGWLFSGQVVIKLAGFLKQVLLAFFLGISSDIDLFLVAQIIPAILSSMVAGGAGEILVTKLKAEDNYSPSLVVAFVTVIFAITVALGGIYLASLPLVSKIYGISADRLALFNSLSLIVVFNKLPAAFVSSLNNLLFFRNKYRFFIISSLISEAAGIIALLFLVQSLGIVAFAWGIFVSSLVNVVFLFIVLDLSPRYVARKDNWVREYKRLKELLGNVMTLSLQTLVNHLSTFWERTFSVRYMTPGYLSALNYSKGLTEMPKAIFLSSILTTTYIEQIKCKAKSEESFREYSGDMAGLINRIAIYFQVLSILFAPLVLIVLLRRGRFDNDAVRETLIIYQILTIGFVPGLLMSFLTRTMYILGKLRFLLYAIIGKLTLEVSIMYLFIQKSDLAIPFALVAGKLFVSTTLILYLSHHFPGIFKVGNLIISYIASILFCIVILLVNQSLIQCILDLNTSLLILYYLLPIAILAVVTFLYIKNSSLKAWIR